MQNHFRITFFVTFTFLDCGDPSVASEYVLGTVGGKTFGNTVTVTCATGYTGNPAAIECQANSQWTVPTGCVIVSEC